MSRSLCTLPILLAVLADPAAARQAPARPDAEVRITPIVGYAPAFRRSERRDLALDGTVVTGEFDAEFAGGGVAGAAVEVRWIDPFRVTAAGLVVSRGAGVETALRNREQVTRPGQKFLLARAGLALRLYEAVAAEQIYPMNAAVFAAPAYIVEIPDRDPVTGRRLNHVGSFGLSWGFEGEAPAGDRVGIQFGAEDWIILWNRDELERRAAAEFAGAGLEGTSTVSPSPSHMWVLRVGIAFRL